ncbi:hypothetical protein COU80_03630 [Candidatus Peregrinibacteria bacterium CG10_big_fil_rev_8_21_14_0_10_55_24]|nr:MAG: hypothetical protein COU80_03630 [Candidatus Peregrinibacteria bacterium CG10_big_fil_rev_8_21_14_0_10_55_24]
MKIFCSGIGGIGLSAYAAYRRAQGHTVLGSDRSASPLIEDLRSQGIEVSLVQDGSAVPEDCDLFVYSEAISSEMSERQRARALGIPHQSYFQALGDLSCSKQVIAVCGTHGKSSTTAMAARVLIDAGIDPSVVVGTKLTELSGRNWRKGAGDIFLLEACEYRRSFLALSPRIVLLTNADGDHFDAFTSREDYHNAFVEFLSLLPQDGMVFTHGADPDCMAIVSRSQRPFCDVDTLPLPLLSVPGLHMRQNAQLVVGLAKHLDIPEEQIRSSLKSYAGCWRRMQVRGVWGDSVTVIDDYAHHPREISATLTALREAYPNRRLVCAFQPHMHDRTLKLYAEFTRCFSAADLVLLTDVYDARSDVETARVDMDRFARDVAQESHREVHYVGDLVHMEGLIKDRFVRPNDVLAFLGAGDITHVAEKMAQDAHVAL